MRPSRSVHNDDDDDDRPVSPPPMPAIAPSHPERSPSVRNLKRSQRNIVLLRIFFIGLLVTVAGVGAGLAYKYVKDDQLLRLQLVYEEAADQIERGFQRSLDVAVGAVGSLSATMTVSSFGDGKYPNVTAPYFQKLAGDALLISRGRAIEWSPLVTADERDGFEAYAVQRADMIDAPADQLSFGIYMKASDGSKVRATGQYVDGDGTPARYQDLFSPVYQIAPTSTNKAAFLLDLRFEENRRRGVDDMILYKTPTLTNMLQLVQDGGGTRPSAILYYPVLKSFSSKAVVGSTLAVLNWDTLLSGLLPSNINGLYVVMETSGNKAGVSAEPFTFRVNGEEVLLEGSGDLHEKDFDRFGREFVACLHTEQVATNHTTEKADCRSQDRIVYTIRTYPSSQFARQYVSNFPAICASVVVVVFVITSSIFLSYDGLVSHQRRRLKKSARESKAIVDSLFPHTVRDRLFRSSANKAAVVPSTSTDASTKEPKRRRREGLERRQSSRSVDGILRNSSVGRTSSLDTRRRSSAISASSALNAGIIPACSEDKKSIGKKISFGAPKVGDQIPIFQMRRFFRQEQKKQPSATSVGEESHQSCDTQVFELDSQPPIADLFQSATVLFADIAGFTQWSSERDPAHVFELLEVIFALFDDIAGVLGVFKISTIGDCYLAVSGIPDAREDHAEVMAEFASECLTHFDSAKKDLATKLGPETLDLELRIGVHSGPVTAGVLRGIRARFEVFGDVVNTASRMESTGLPSKIQVSQATKDLLVEAGLSDMLVAREETIQPKGKGSMQTYWFGGDLESDDNCAIGKGEAHASCARRRNKATADELPLNDADSSRHVRIQICDSEPAQ